MNHYVTGLTIKAKREELKLTQAELGKILGVSDKTISKWENSRGLPDITLVEPLSKALNMSVIELMTGEYVTNQNISSNMLRSKLYVCPICGNVIHAMGESVISCCGITIPILEAEEDDDNHIIKCEKVEDEFYITLDHPMTKEHYVSFIAYVNSNKFELIKMYPEGNAEARFFVRGHGFIYAYCNKHGLYKYKI